MKKFLFLAAAASMVLAACNKTEVVYTDGPQEIAMFAVNNVATKAGPVTTEEFPTGDWMEVAAYSLTETKDYFPQTTFKKVSTYWTGGQYWPVTDATLTFLAVSEPATESPLTIAFNKTNYASGANVTLADNSTKQYDLMYAAGQGKREGSAPEKVDMVFKHALSWVNFKVKDTENSGKIKVKSLKLNGCYYTGNLTLTNTTFDKTSTSSADVKVEWTRTGSAADLLVYETEVICSDKAAEYGTGLLVVPGSTTGASFTIVYTIDDGAEITYTTTDALTPTTWENGKKYTYVIGFGALTEIAINPTVDVYITDLDSNGTEDDEISVDVQ